MHFDNLAGYFNVMPTTEEQIVLPIWVSLKLEIMKDKTLVYKNWLSYLGLINSFSDYANVLFCPILYTTVWVWGE